MNSKRLWATTATIFVLSAFGPRSPVAWAQQSQMAACNAGWSWNQNSLGQDPCVVSSMLDATCRDIAVFTIPPLNSTQSYVPPQGNSSDLTCDCDSVMYSLYMACSTCQGGMIYSWTRWIAECENVYVTQYPHDVPQGTRIPQWAFYNVSLLPDQTYNDTVAIKIGRNPEATPKAILTTSLNTATPTSTKTPTLSTLTFSTSTSARGSTNTNVPKRKSKTGAIVGGVVGTIVPLSILAVLAFFYARRRKQGGENQPLPPSQTQDVSEYYKAQPTTPVSPTTGNLPYNPYYNPNDPTTFPPPVGDGQSSVTYTTTFPPHGPQGQGQGRYSGIPEI